MKFMIAMFLCLFFVFTAPAQTESETKTKKTKVADIALFKDDGKGAAGDETYVFSTTDKPLHCQILLDAQQAAFVKMEMVAVEVKGMKSGAKTVTVSYKTAPDENAVNFRFSPKTIWAAGKYKIVVSIDGIFSAEKEIEITSEKVENIYKK